jgi:hypothetical protein
MHASSLISFTQRRSRLHAWWRRLRHERKESSSHAWGTNQSFARYDDDSRPAWPVIEITRQLRVSDRIRVSLLQVNVEDLRIPPAGPALGKQCIAWCLLTRRLVQWTYDDDTIRCLQAAGRSIDSNILKFLRHACLGQWAVLLQYTHVHAL